MYKKFIELRHSYAGVRNALCASYSQCKGCPVRAKCDAVEWERASFENRLLALLGASEDALVLLRVAAPIDGASVIEALEAALGEKGGGER